MQDYEVFANETRREWPKPKFEQGPMHPAVNVSWEDAVAFCAWLSKKEERTYRLPTDAEWSVAVGLAAEVGGTPEEKSMNGPRDVYPWGQQWPQPRGFANFSSNLQVADFEYTSPVGSFAANSLGLYDLSGNVWEWCDDWYSRKKDSRVVRGASWGKWRNPEYLRSSYRFKDHPANRNNIFGFRCVLVSGR